MLVKSLEVKNFRSIRHTILDYDNTTILAGRNGAGKSSFLHALDVFYDLTARITEDDFFNRDISSAIEIRVTFGDLREDERKEFESYIRDEKLIITKRISFENGRLAQRYFAATLQIPQFATIRAISGKKERTSAWKELASSGQFPELMTKVKSADEVEQLMLVYEVKHPELTEAIEREEQFFGPKNIGGGKLDKFTKYVLVPAVREAAEEVSGRKSAIYQILDMIVLRKISARKDLREFKQEFDQRVKQLYSSKNLTELSELGQSISKTLEQFAPNSKLNLEWDEVEAPEIQLPAAKAIVMEDKFEGPIDRKGHGLQRALILTLLQHLAMAVPYEPVPEKTNDTPQPDTRNSSKGPDLILAIEEPELYLHPSRCRYLAQILSELAINPASGMGGRNQIIYTTHSPYFIDLNHFDQIRIVRKLQLPDSPAPETAVTQYTWRQAANELASVCKRDPDIYTADRLRVRSLPIMTSIVNEGFFADAVVLVEGRSELGGLYKLQEILQKNWYKLGISIIPVTGKDNLDRPTLIFRGLSIPTYFIFDADSNVEEKDRQRTIDRNRRYLRLAGAQTEEDFPDSQVHSNWAVFRKNFESVLEDALGSNAYQSVKQKVDCELQFNENVRVSKNVERFSRIIETAYQDGHRIPVLERIVENITQLCKQ